MVKVTVCGAAGGIGQPLSLLLKQSNLLSHLALYDIVNAHGVAADLSHIDTNSKVTSHVGPTELEEALRGADVVVIPAGVPRKPGMSRDDLFKINAGIVRDLAVAAANYAPTAIMCIISNPVNSTVPIVAEVFKKYGVYNPRKILGVTTLDLVRSSTFLSEKLDANPRQVNVPVVGGHSGVTIIPLLSQVPGVADKLSEQEIQELTKRIQFAGDEVVKAKDGAGSATLSMAYAGARFTLNLVESIFKGVHRIECAYVNLEADVDGANHSVRRVINNDEDIEYFSVPIEFGPEGIHRILPIGKMSKYEYHMLTAAVQELKNSIVKGVTFITEDSKL